MKNFHTVILTVVTVLITITAYSQQPAKGQQPMKKTTKPIKYTAEEKAAESKRLNAWFDSIWDASVDRNPVFQTYLGIKKDYYSWGDQSDSNDIKEHNILLAELEQIKTSFDPDKLDPIARTSYRLWIADAEQKIQMWQFHYHTYPFDQMDGAHTWIPSFLFNMHQVTDKTDAAAYVLRLEHIDSLMDQLIAKAKIREEKGIIMPQWCFLKSIDDCKGIITGIPFDASTHESAFLVDLKSKVNKLNDIDENAKRELILRGQRALITSVKPAYDKLIAYLYKEVVIATEDEGVWKLPNGEQYYSALLNEMTTTKLTPDTIFSIGQKEIARIHNEIRGIMKQVNFKSDSLQDFFKFMRTDKQFYLPNTDEGRKKYFDMSQTAIDSMHAYLPKLFTVFPKAKLVVKEVEKFREKTAGSAFYEPPAPDGSRPGTYYVNLSDLSQVPTFEIEALCHHEALPGHHMQISIAQELGGLPKFRTLGGDYTAYVEGWGLYCEYIPKEFGFYKDPYADFGRLSMELFRACRLVVDVGIHAKKWTKQQGIDFYLQNSATSEGECVSMVERHIVMPAQATAYKVGQMKILELLKHSREKLGPKFDIRKFHDLVLGSGALPLNILEENVNAWIAKQQVKK